MNLFRTGWDLLRWNFRKTFFRLRGGTGRAPCQHPSDSGRAFETGCIACGAWKKPIQFKKICPLLVETPQGLRCSVDARDVRPFWRPVLLFYGSAVAAVYLTLLAGAFVALRSIGYPVHLADLVWPRSWHRVADARSQLLATKARNAFAAGNFREALLLLQNAHEAAPGNYDLSLDLATISGAVLPDSGNAQFARLMADHPEKRDNTALRWLDKLVTHAEFKTISDLAVIQLAAGPKHADIWARALFFAAEQLGSTEALQKLAADPRKNLDPWRDSLRLETARLEKNRPQVESLLRAPWPADRPGYAKFHRLHTLAATEGGLACLETIRQHPDELDAASRVLLVLGILSELNFEARRAAEVDLLLSRQKNADVLRMLCTHSIRHRDEIAFSRAYAAVTSVDPAGRDKSLWFSLLTAAGTVRNAAAMNEIATRLRDAPETRALSAALQDFFAGKSERPNFASFLPALGLPLEENYALLENPPPPLVRRENSP